MSHHCLILMYSFISIFVSQLLPDYINEINSLSLFLIVCTLSNCNQCDTPAEGCDRCEDGYGWRVINIECTGMNTIFSVRLCITKVLSMSIM